MIGILELSHLLSPYVVGFEGNVSCKTNDGILIKASGKSLKNLTLEDLVLCDLFNRKIGNTELHPSMEIEFHTWLLGLPNINYVAHTHPSHVLQILCSDHIYEFTTERLFPDQVVFNGTEYCIVNYAHPGHELYYEIKKSVTEYYNKLQRLPKVILLKNHGIITIGSTAEECLMSTEICEKSAEVFIGLKKIGFENYLTKDDIKMIVNDGKENHRQSYLKWKIK